MLRIALGGFGLLVATTLAGCVEESTGPMGIGDGEESGGSGSGRPAGEGSAGAESDGTTTTTSSSPSSSSTGTGEGEIEPGTLTAGVWDDNRNFDRFLEFRSELYDEASEGLPPFSEAEHHDARETHGRGASPHRTLDIALVVDTTGSMGDEIRYLQSEFTAISSTIEERFPDAEQRWALVVYRDEGDEYLTRWFEFREDPEAFRKRLAEQEANGGGDYPEAPDAALDIMNQFAWRTDDGTARLAFWVADAPHHPHNADAMADGIRRAQDNGIHVYPVASSGVDKTTEMTMRASAQLTGGRYVFLTDDSGVGGSHIEPSIPCYFVTRLDHAILRMVDIEMTGDYRQPAKENIIRTGGDPTDGACTLEDGETARIF